MQDLQQALFLIADELRGMATVGNHFALNIYEVERAHRIMELAAKVASLADHQPPEAVKSTFDLEPWLRYSPAIGVEAMVLNAKREVLLIQRRDNGRWAMPGGLAEIGQTLSEAVLRELWEEAGLRGEVRRLLGIFDGRLWGSTARLHLIHVVFEVECSDLTPHPGIEAIDAQFFAQDSLPPIEMMHGGHEQRIARCFEVLEGAPYFDAADAQSMKLTTHQQAPSEPKE